MTAKQFMAQLAKCGWLTYLPEPARAAVIAGVDAAVVRGDEAWTGIPSVLYPFAEANPGSIRRGQYAKYLRELVVLSHGVLPLDSIREKVVDGRRELHYSLGAKRGRVELQQGDGMLHYALEFTLRSLNTPLRFLDIPDECGGTVFTTERALEKAIKKGLVPDGSDW
jgi:hypothetical protein